MLDDLNTLIEETVRLRSAAVELLARPEIHPWWVNGLRLAATDLDTAIGRLSVLRATEEREEAGT